MPEYDFKTLSPADFELLVRDLLTAEYGWRLEAFGHGQDGGVDLRGHIADLKVVVQCKHYAGSTFADLRNSARKEVAKMEKEKPNRYLFATTQGLSRGQKDTLVGDLSPWLSDSSDLLTQLDINEMLGRHSNVERQHFKLWLASVGVLEQIVRSGLWARSEAMMEDIVDRVKLYVRSQGYERSAVQLNKNHVVVLTGAPGVGKSLLAEMLLLAHWHKGWQVVAISSDVDEGWDAYQKGERQIFYYDDFLGQTDVSERGSKNEDDRIVRFMDRVSKDPLKRLVMTTRSQILRQAMISREQIARGRFEIRECVVEIADYGTIERAQILYNHLYFSELEREVVRDYAAGEYYWQVVNHANFSPRVVEQVLKQGAATADMLATRLSRALDRPIDLWGPTFSVVLSNLAQRIVLTLVTFPVDGALASLLRQIAQQGARPLEYTHALRALEGTFIKVQQQSPFHPVSIAYADPSVRDFVLALLDDEPQYFVELVTHVCDLEGLLRLLQYAASATDNGYKFPGLVAAVSAHSQPIVDRFSVMIESTIEAANAQPYVSAHVRNDALNPAAAILYLLQGLIPERIDAIAAKVLALIDEHGAYVEAFEKITKVMVARNRNRLGDTRTEVRKIVQAWGESLDTVDAISEFAAFVQGHIEAFTPYFDVAELLERYAEQALRSEIETISGNRQGDEETDQSWLRSVEEMARQLGMYARLQEDIDYERLAIEQYYEDREPDDPTPTSGAGSWRPSSPDLGSQSQIDGLFRQLS